MKLSPWLLAFSAALLASPAARPAEPPPAGLQTDFKLGLGGFGEGARDLGLGQDDSTAEGFIDAQSTLYWNSGRDWGALMRAQAFAPSGELVVTDEDQPRRSESYVRLRELWFEYKGFTSYPGELLRAGLQRLRDPDGLWFDRNIESLRWIFDTTLVQGQVGVAESLLTWRSDQSEPSSNLRDRAYLFGGLGSQWRAGHFVGTRVIHALDHGNPEADIASMEPDPKLSERRLTWIDLYAHNGYYERSQRPGWSYWGDVSALVGTREDYQPATATEPTTRQDSDVRALSADVGLRWRLPVQMPLQVGGGYSFASGSNEGFYKYQYEQTGLHSNLSRFTGTRSQLYRYTEALQADLSNLHVGTLYVSIPQERWDASLIYNSFARHRANGPIIADGISVAPVPGRKRLGDGLDLAVAYYFSNLIGRGQSTVSAPQEDDDLRSNIRLRLSGFQPGPAFPDEADSQYRVRLELTLWF